MAGWGEGVKAGCVCVGGWVGGVVCNVKAAVT